MHIHFVCSGNAYRSRLAEAYCRSIMQSKNCTVSSSGIDAVVGARCNGPICWYAMRLIKLHNLIPFMSWKEQQTTSEILSNVDILICMKQSHLEYCQNQLGYTGKSYEVWNIPDLNEMEGFIPSTISDEKVDLNNIRLTEQTYSTIVQKVDDLVKRIV